MTRRDISAQWEAHFRHGAGELASHFYRAIRDDAALLGWRTGSGVSVPPRHGGHGEWVTVGPGASLVAHAASHEAQGDWLALVAIDGADGCTFWRVRAADPATLRAGTRLVACFAGERTGSPRDVWFEVAEGT